MKMDLISTLERIEQLLQSRNENSTGDDSENKSFESSFGGLSGLGVPDIRRRNVNGIDYASFDTLTTSQQEMIIPIVAYFTSISVPCSTVDEAVFVDFGTQFTVLIYTRDSYDTYPVCQLYHSDSNNAYVVQDLSLEDVKAIGEMILQLSVLEWEETSLGTWTKCYVDPNVIQYLQKQGYNYTIYETGARIEFNTNVSMDVYTEKGGNQELDVICRIRLDESENSYATTIREFSDINKIYQAAMELSRFRWIKGIFEDLRYPAILPAVTDDVLPPLEDTDPSEDEGNQELSDPGDGIPSEDDVAEVGDMKKEPKKTNGIRMRGRRKRTGRFRSAELEKLKEDYKKERAAYESRSKKQNDDGH